MNKLIIKNIIQFNYIFNFAASYSGGGQKRLYEYMKWFNANGGAFFVINYRCENLVNEFSNNNYLIVNQTKCERLFLDHLYLEKIMNKNWTLYFAYGIPVYRKIAAVNWFHISNILPFVNFKISLDFLKKIQMLLLRFKIIKNIKNVDVISGESNYSINTVKQFLNSTKMYYLLKNGCEKELLPAENNLYENCAVIIGTQRYKQLDIAHQIYRELKQKGIVKELFIIGENRNIPSNIQRDDSIKFTGVISRDKVYNILKKSEYFITSTEVENSSNASLEGVLLARKSVISDIEPHRELLEGCEYDILHFDKLAQRFFYVESFRIKNKMKFLSWDNVIKKQIDYIKNILGDIHVR